MVERHRVSLVQFSSVAQSGPTLYDPMSCSTSGLPVQHQVPEPTQTYVHCIGDATLPSHPLSPPSPPAFSFSQHPCIFGQDTISAGKQSHYYKDGWEMQVSSVLRTKNFGEQSLPHPTFLDIKGLFPMSHTYTVDILFPRDIINLG